MPIRQRDSMIHSLRIRQRWSHSGGDIPNRLADEALRRRLQARVPASTTVHTLDEIGCRALADDESSASGGHVCHIQGGSNQHNVVIPQT